MRLSKKQTIALDILENSPVKTVLYGGSAGCFTGDTLVQTIRGHKKISEILAGDLVLSLNIFKQVMEYKSVQRLWFYPSPNAIIELENGIRCTPSHKFRHNRQWLKIADIVDDDKPVEYNNARNIARAECKFKYVDSCEPVYDLQVADNHNYTVTTENIIVHNSGKSLLMVYWLLKQCVKYPGVRYLLGRKTRATLYKTTVNTLYEVAKMQGLKAGVHFTLNKQSDIINFFNGSEILFMNLETKPSDPNYDDVGSLELTGAAIDEVPQVEERYYEIIQSRIRYKLDLVGGVPKMLVTANPTKGWLKRVFYDRHVKGTLPDTMQFISALPTDNPFIPAIYLQSLYEMNETDKQRLLYGNWEYADDETQMIKQPEIDRLLLGADMPDSGERFMTADIALEGNDLLVIGIWQGWHLIYASMLSKTDGGRVLYELKFLSEMYDVPISHIAYDADGVGGYLHGFLKGAVPFQNGASPIVTEKMKEEIAEMKEQNIPYKKHYPNLKTQCSYILAQKINSGEMTMDASALDTKGLELFAQDLSFIRGDKIDNDDMSFILPKKDIKKALGRSPDISDMAMMRGIFELIESNDSPYKGLAKKRRS